VAACGFESIRTAADSPSSPASTGSASKDAASQASDAAVLNQGKVVVVAAGNDGDGEQTIASPGVSTQAITVGAASDQSAPVGDPGHDNGLYLAAFSSRGPTANPSAPLKPDVVAPGLTVVSAKRATTSGYITYSGTSMATPFVSGVVALGLEAVPGATPAQVKAALQSSAHDAGIAGPDNDWGYGLVDARAFIETLKGVPSATTGPFPDHSVVNESVPNAGTKDIPITVSRSGEPLGISLRIDGTQSCSAWILGTCWAYEWSPDLDATLRDPSGTEVAMTECPLDATNGNCGSVGRWETLGVGSAVAGTWTLRVVPYSGSPNNGKGGLFTVDVFGALGATEPPPPPPPATVPAAPDGLAANATSRSSISLAWVNHADNQTGFSLERCKGATCTNFVEVTRTTGTTWVNTGLKSGTTYRYRVRAYNAVGFSAYSNIDDATTLRR
jgi:serine protease AprX